MIAADYAIGDRVVVTHDAFEEHPRGTVIRFTGHADGVLVVLVDGHTNTAGLWFGPDHVRKLTLPELIGETDWGVPEPPPAGSPPPPSGR